jgi:hypothetical protein
MADETEQWEFGWGIYKDCFSLLREHTKMASIVVISPITVFISWFVALLIMIPLDRFRPPVARAKQAVPMGEYVGTDIILAYLMILVFIFVASFVISFYNVIIVSYLKDIIDGEKPSVVGGVTASVRNLPVLVVSSLLMSLVGFIILLGERSNSSVGRLSAYLFGASYAVLTFFALPAAVLDSENFLTMYKRSASLVKERFGDVTKVSLGVYVAGYGIAATIAGIPMMATTVVILVKTVSPEMARRGGILLTSTPSLVVSGIFFLTAISSFIFALHFAAVLKTVLYVETVEGSRPEVLEQSVEYVEELSQEDESDFKPTETVQ